jgi:hypothetical protein
MQRMYRYVGSFLLGVNGDGSLSVTNFSFSTVLCIGRVRNWIVHSKRKFQWQRHGEVSVYGAVGRRNQRFPAVCQIRISPIS